jgi:uncharacterized protein YlxW (UPF0749 family)
MAEEAFTGGVSGEEYLRKEGGDPEVIDLRSKTQKLQAKQAQLQKEISIYQSQINELAGKMETAQLAFQQCVVLRQLEEADNGS